MQNSLERLIFVSTLLLTVIGLVRSQNCTDAKIKSCLRAFDESKVSPDTIDADLPNWSESLEELRDRCRWYSLFSQCISSVLPMCNQSIQDYIKGLNQGYRFLCDNGGDEGLQKVVEYQKCYVIEKVRQGANFCNITYMDNIKTIQGPDRITQYCSYTDAYLRCLTTSVQSLCDQDAADWQKNWNKAKRYQQMAVTFKCEGWKTSDDNSATIWTIILSVVLGLATLIMVVGIIIILIFINRKKKSHRRRGGVPPPPPYTSDPYGVYDGPAPVVSADTSEPILSLPAQSSSSNSLDGASGGQTVAVNMRPNAKYPVKPPPYADQAAPAYENAVGAAAAGASGGNSGQLNEGYKDTEGSKVEEEEEDIKPSSAEPGTAAATNVTESERELNSNWF